MIYTFNFPPNNSLKLAFERLMTLRQEEWEKKIQESGLFDGDWHSTTGFVKTPLEYRGRSGTYLLWLTYKVSRGYSFDEGNSSRAILSWQWGLKFALQSVYDTEPSPSNWTSTLRHRQIDFFWPCYACQGESTWCEVCSYVASPQFGGVWMKRDFPNFNDKLPTQQFLFDLAWTLEQFRTLEYDSLLELYGQRRTQWDEEGGIFGYDWDDFS